MIDAFLKYLPAESVLSYSGEIRYSDQAREQRGYAWYDPVMRQVISGMTGGRTSPLRPDSPDDIFWGEVYVLTSGFTYSSGNWIAVVLRDNGLARVVGEPTGNAPSSYGDTLQFRLPNSGLDFTVSHKRWIRPQPANDPADTLMPDELIPTTMRDVREGRDPVVEWLELCCNRRGANELDRWPAVHINQLRNSPR